VCALDAVLFLAIPGIWRNVEAFRGLDASWRSMEVSQPPLLGRGSVWTGNGFASDEYERLSHLNLWLRESADPQPALMPNYSRMYFSGALLVSAGIPRTRL
jgi:hypothetical protein